MMHLSAYGRLGADPKSIQTKTGTSMAVANLAVSLEDRQGEGHTQWLGVVTFGKVAETLMKHSKGDLVSVAGRAQHNAYTDRDGNEREQLQVIADAVISARSVRPGGKKKAPNQSAQVAPNEGNAVSEPAGDFNDSIPF